jgi:two-component sensor histidine kinase
METSCFRVFRRYSTLHLRAARAKREKRCEQSMSRRQHVNVGFDPQVRLFHQAVLLHELNHRINNEFSSAISAISLAAARDLPGARQRSTAKERCSRTRAKDRP